MKKDELKKKLWLVKREVRANSLKEAMITKGHIYEISLADDKYQPDTDKKDVGFKNKK